MKKYIEGVTVYGIDIGKNTFHVVGLDSTGATELLRRGTSLQRIADFLGHRDVRSVGVSAEQDVQSLRLIADFNLNGIV